MFDVLVLIVGFVLLVKAADLLVDGASSLARRLAIPEFVVGLTLCAFGTSAPELFVNGVGSLRGQDALVLGNVLGSNVFNMLLVLGVGGVICPLAVRSSTFRQQLPYSVLATGVFLALANDAWFFEGQPSVLSRLDGLVLLAGFAVFLSHALSLDNEASEDGVCEGSLGRSMVWTAAGLVGLPAGAHLVVVSATGLASALGLSEALIGLTVLSVGTSLPELAATAMAARKGNVDLAVGNVVGSNLFNLLLVLGVSSAIDPIAHHAPLNVDALVFVAACVVVFAAVIAQKRRELTRPAGGLLVACFVAYVGFLGVREARESGRGALLLELADHQVHEGLDGEEARDVADREAGDDRVLGHLGQGLPEGAGTSGGELAFHLESLPGPLLRAALDLATGDLDAEGALEPEGDVEEVERLGSQIVDHQGVGRDFVLIEAQGLTEGVGDSVPDDIVGGHASSLGR